MSRIICYSKYKNRDVEVVGGWDEPLQYYHLTVFLRFPEPWESEVVWENIDNLGFTKNILPLKKQLQEMNIKVPDNFWPNCEEKAGNFVKRLT